MECPGVARCPPATTASPSRPGRAASADVVVVNTHLYGLDLAAEGVLPEHEVVVIDEAHQLEDTVSATIGIELGPGRLAALRRIARGILDDADPDGGRAAGNAPCLRGPRPAGRGRRRGRAP